MYYVYIIKCDDDTLYTGIAKNICKRIKEHYYKLDKCAKYTKHRNVKSLEALWRTNTRSNASKLEYYIKKLHRLQKIKLIQTPYEVEKINDFMCMFECLSNVTLNICLENDELQNN